MKKYLKIILISFICLSISFYCGLTVYAKLGDAFDPNNIASDSSASPEFTTQFDKIWSTAVYVSRIAAFTGIMILGITYIFSNADRKADLKKSLVPVLIGVVIFFGATYVIDFVKAIFGQL